jgi:L,D-peptidoglycan transpeptidase YkuD (ErfK/YbiS/YcfS/YnhG family)
MIARTLILTLLSITRLLSFELPANSTQCLLGVATDWNTSKVSLTLFEKKAGTWMPVSEPWPARLGKNGLVWGLGISPAQAGAVKKEGDMRSPAGVFAIGGAWGYAPSIRKQPKMAYRQVTSHDLWVEDPASPSYNRNLILDHEPATPWELKQQMKQTDPVHALKLFIAHNAPPNVVPNAGSSIFFHIWRNAVGRATAGCTTMDQAKLYSLVAKIDPARNPVYVLLPQAEYSKLRERWKLP